MSESKENVARRKWLTAYAPLIIWIGLILLLGSSQGSMNRTSIIIRPLLEFLFPTATPETITFYHGVVRKVAHLTEYAVLGVLAMRAFATTRSVIWPLLIVMAVAATDEFIQSFNPARTGSPVDVAIDITGGILAIGVVWLARRHRASRPG